MTDTSVHLPENVSVETFKPIAYYDEHMDFIRVMTHDRSVTEHRIDGILTIHECNHRELTDPQFVGFTIKGIKRLFHEIDLPLEGVLKLADLIDRMVGTQPEVMTLIKLIFQIPEQKDNLEIDFREAA